MESNIYDKNTLSALKKCITGMKTEEVTSEYTLDDETGQMKMVKRKVVEKHLPPNTDLIKLIYQHIADNAYDYEKMTDEELERERLRLLSLLKEDNSDSRTSEDKSKV